MWLRSGVYYRDCIIYANEKIVEGAKCHINKTEKKKWAQKIKIVNIYEQEENKIKLQEKYRKTTSTFRYTGSNIRRNTKHFKNTSI
jgi:hypothetical protein